MRYGNRNFLPWSLSYDSYPSLPPLSFLQTKQLTSLVVFYFASPRGGNCLILPVTGYAHAQDWAPECPNIRNFKGLRVRPVWRWTLWKTHFATIRSSVGLKGLTTFGVHRIDNLSRMWTVVNNVCTWRHIYDLCLWANLAIIVTRILPCSLHHSYPEHDVLLTGVYPKGDCKNKLPHF